MKIALCGPVEGHITSFYEHLAAASPDIRWALCVGDLGLWPDRQKIPREARTHGAGTDFSRMYALGTSVPVPTVTVCGVHDDARWLKQRQDMCALELLPNLHWLVNGHKTIIGWGEHAVRVTGLGKVYSKSTYEGQFNKKSHRHYTRPEVEKGCSSGPTDVLLLHGDVDEPGARNLIFATRPNLIVTAARPGQSPHLKVQDRPLVALRPKEIVIVEI
jgi:hypothetical protein